MTSLVLSRPKRRLTRSVATPHHWLRMASLVVGWAMIAGVQSTVWIFAIRAPLIMRALS